MKIDSQKVALVTGASAGIGAATSIALAKAGVGTVVMVARRLGQLEEVAQQVRAAGAKVLTFSADCADANAVRQVVAAVEKQVGTPDILINNAGSGRWLFIDETEMEEAVSMMGVPYFAAFFMSRAFLPGMIRRGSGQIINVNSVAAYMGWQGACAYSAARWALRGLTECMRADLRGTGVGVSTVCPGVVSSDYFSNNPGTEARVPKISMMYPTMTPEQVADAIVHCVRKEYKNYFVPFLIRWTVRLHRICPILVEPLILATAAKPPPLAHRTHPKS
jgi:uncharacterized protein